MVTVMRTVKQPDVRRQEILDGAIRVFARNGYDKTTIAGIAKELNISQGLCYRYFPSKEDIYHAAIEKYADLILQAYLSQRQSEQHIQAWIDSIADSIGCMTAAEKQDEGLYALFHGSNSEALHNELLLKVAARLLPYIQQVLRCAKDKGEIAIDDPEQMAIIGLYGELGVFFEKGLTPDVRLHTIRLGWNRLLGLNESE